MDPVETQDQNQNAVQAKNGPQPIRAKDDDVDGSGDFFEGSGEDDEDLGSAFYPLEWSSWSPCSASCGSATQSRWSRCADSAGMMDCIQAGLEKKMTRSCGLEPCPTISHLNEYQKKTKKGKEEQQKSSHINNYNDNN